MATIVFGILNLVLGALKLWATVQLGKTREEKIQAMTEMNDAYRALSSRLTPEELRDEATILANSHSTILK